MKRVLFYVYEWPPVGGGVATAAKSILEELSKDPELSFDVITTAIDGKYAKKSLKKNLTLHYLPIGDRSHALNTQTPFQMILFWITSYFYTWKLIFSQKQFDLSWTFGYPGGLVSWLFSWKWPYLISLRGVDVPGYNQKFSLWYRFYRPLSRVIWQRASVVSCNSQWLARLAKQTASEINFVRIPNGVDTTLYHPVSEREKFKKFTITAGATVMGPKKNLDLLIRSFAQFHKQISNSELLLIGDGVLKSELEELVTELNIKDAVRFVGRKDASWIAKNLPKCHLLCLPSKAEGMSNAILAGMACGLPIITTKPSEELIDGNGVVVSDDEDEITNVFFDLYTDTKKRITWGKRSREIAEEMSWEEVAVQLKKEVI